jgi:hypothetical protein
MRLMQSGNDFRMRGFVTAAQPPLLGTIAIEIDAGQSVNAESFSRKIHISSVLEILLFANRKFRFRFTYPETGESKAAQPGSRFNLTGQPYRAGI